MAIALVSAAIFILDFLSIASPAHGEIDALVPIPLLIGIPIVLLYNKRKFGACLPGARPPLPAEANATDRMEETLRE